MKPSTMKSSLLPAAAIGIALLSCGAVANAQVVITEFLSDDAGGNAEYIEIYNSGMAAVDIGGFTVADEETIGDGEGAYSFPAGTSIGSGEVIVTTSDATMLAAGANNPSAGTQVFEWSDSDSDASNDLIKKDALATGNITLSNGGDEIILYDASDAIVDGIAYGDKTLVPYATVGAPGDDLAAVRLNLANQPALVIDWATNQTPSLGAVPFINPNATCSDLIGPCGVNEDCSGVAGSIVCSCTPGFVEDALGTCIESCTTLACTLAGQVCNTATEICECDTGTTDYGNGACISPAIITCDEDNLGYGHLGQAGDDTIPNGGCLTDDATALGDTGILALVTALAGASDPQNGVTLDPPVQIVGAVIAATNEAGDKDEFYIQDANGTIATSLSVSGQPPFNIRVGQKVSFTVTEVELYFGNPRITAASNWAILSDGNFVAAPTAINELVETDGASIIHLSGIAVESRGDDGLCDDGQCYRVESADGVSVVVRVAASEITLGSQVEVVGPLEYRGDLSALLIDGFTNSFWVNIQDPECTVETDCTGTDETCVNFECKGPAPTDECDSTTPCTGTGEICDAIASPKVCVCDEDNLFVDDGNGVCVTVDCIGDVDCVGDFQVCAANACECDAGYENVDTTGGLDCQLIAAATCGDGTCDTGETATSCPADCGTTGPTCGDDVCEGDEDATSCPADCDSTTGPTCGDGTCDAGEDATSCPADCSTTGPTCGDGTCDAGEDATSCPADCDSGVSESVCGDGFVTGDEECDGGPRCSDICKETIVVGGGGGGDCSSTSGGAGFPASLLIALGMLVGVTRKRKRS